MYVCVHKFMYMYEHIYTLTGNIHIVYLLYIYVTTEHLMKSGFLPADIAVKRNLKRKTLLPGTGGDLKQYKETRKTKKTTTTTPGSEFREQEGATAERDP